MRRCSTEGQAGWLLPHTGGRFVLMLFVSTAETLSPATRAALRELAAAPLPVHTLVVAGRDGDAPAGSTLVVDVQGRAAKRFDARPGTAYLLRPDQHVAARWRRLDPAAVRSAVRALPAVGTGACRRPRLSRSCRDGRPRHPAELRHPRRSARRRPTRRATASTTR